MAVLAIPAAGALIGGALFSWGTTAMSVGWMLGSWLYGATSHATTPGINPKSMPNINQALRGSPLFVTFGTNRISAQVVWTKNWKATRLKSSGKGGGKGGGSGGGGSSKGGGSGTQTYTYSWDIMFNFGMVDVPMFIKRGWVGGDAMDEITLSAILAGWPAAQAQIPFILAGIFGGGTGSFSSANKPKAKLDFVEAWYAPGEPTGSTDLLEWAYFTSQEGRACSWPYTVNLGLKTLQLGQSGMIPQCSFEIGPLDGAATTFTDNQFLNLLNPADVSSSIFSVLDNPQNQAMMVGDDGKRYTILLTNNKWLLYCIDTDTAVNIDSTYVGNRFTEVGGIAGTAGTTFIFGAPSKKWFFIVTLTPTVDVTYWVPIVRVRINADGSQTADGYINSQSSNLNAPEHVYGVEADDFNCYAAISIGISLGSHGRPTLLKLPLTGSSDDHLTPGSWDLKCTTLGFGDFFWEIVNVLSTRAMSQAASVIIDPLTGQVGVLAYIGQDWIDNTNSYGFLGAGNTLIDTATTPLIVYSNGGGYLDMTADFGAPFSDGMKKYDGTASANYVDEYTAPSILNGTVIAFMRGYSDKAEYYNMRLFAWNSGNPTPIITHQARFWDDVAQGGVSSGNRDVAYPNEIQVGLDQSTAHVILQATIHAHGGVVASAKVYSDVGTLITGAASDVTPAYIIYRILNSDVFGFSIPASRIDQASYASAHQYCLDQGIIVSVTYTTQDNMLQVIDELCSLYGGFLIDDSGTIKFGVVRSTDTPDPVVVDNTRLLSPGKGQPPVAVQKGAIQDGYNKVKFNYIDRQIDYKQNQIEVSDEVDIDLNGPRVKEFPATYVMAGSLAQMEAERGLWTNLYGRDIFTFKLGAKDAHRQPGDVITLVDSYHPLLRGGVAARIMKWKESKRLEFDVQAVQIIPYQITANHDFTNTTSGDPGSTLISSVEPPLAQRMYEVPKEFQGAKAQLYVGYNQATLVMGAQLYLSFDAGASYVLTQDVQPFIISGLFPQALENRPNGFCERDIEFYLMPTRSFSITTPTFAQTHDLDAISQGIRAAGGGVFIVGSEAVSAEDLTLLGQNHYRAKRLYRGWGGTPIGAHSSGAYWHYHSAGMFNYEITEDKIGTVLYYKVAPYNFAGAVADLSSLTAGSYQIKGLYWLPRYQPRTKTWVQSAISWPRSTEIGERAFFKTTSGGCDVTFTWPAAAQLEGFGAGGYGGGGFGHFAADILTPAYRVNVYSTNGFSVRSSVVNTGFFTYDLPTNSADFSGFAQDFFVKVTPYTVKGDGPVSDVRTLKLFW